MLHHLVLIPFTSLYVICSPKCRNSVRNGKPMFCFMNGMVFMKRNEIVEMNDLIWIRMDGMYGNDPWRAWRLRGLQVLKGW